MSAAATVSPAFGFEVVALLRDQRANDAVLLASEGVRNYPSYIGGYILLSRCYQQLGHLEAASVILDEVERRFPDRAVTKNSRRVVAELERINAAELERTNAAEQSSRTDDGIGSTSDDVLATDMPESDLSTEHFEQDTILSAEPVGSVFAAAPLLRVINLAAPANDTRVLRSTSMRLIPGLEYTSLRFEGAKHRGQRSIQQLPQPPSFRDFHSPRVSTVAARQSAKPSLENLAERISKVRITAETLEQRPPAPTPAPSQSRPLYTETLTRIYMQQERWTEAIEGWEALMLINPKHKVRYQEYIEECRLRKGAS